MMGEHAELLKWVFDNQGSGNLSRWEREFLAGLQEWEKLVQGEWHLTRRQLNLVLEIAGKIKV